MEFDKLDHHIKLMNAATKVTIGSGTVRENLNNFIKRCIFYDMHLGFYNIDQLKTADDIWVFIKPYQSQNRFINYQGVGENSSSGLFSCKDSLPLIERDFGAEIGGWRVSNVETTSVTGGKPETQNIEKKVIALIDFLGRKGPQSKRLFMDSLPNVGDYLVGVSKSSEELLRQSMMINMINFSTESNEAEHNVQAYQNARAEYQTNSTYKTIGAQAEKALPMLKILIQVIFIGSFPIVILLCFVPNLTVQTLKGYITTFIWLASWGPLYAILNRVISGYTADSIQHYAGIGGGYTLWTIAPITEITANMSALAGYLSMFIPMLAYGIARGGTAAMSSMTTSFLSVAQGAASQAANEGVSGNMSFGNVNSFKRDASHFEKGGGFSTTTMPSGQLVNHNQDGSTSIARGLSESDTGYHINASKRLENHASEQISQEQSLGKEATVSSQMSEAQGREKLINHRRDIESSDQYSRGFSSEAKDALGRVSKSTEDFGHKHKLDNNKSVEVLASASAGVSFAGYSAKLEAYGKLVAVDQETYEAAQHYAKENNLSHDLSLVKSAVKSSHLNIVDNNGESINQSFDKAARLQEDASMHFRKAENYSQNKQHIESNSAAIDRNYDQEFFNYVKDNVAEGSAVKTADLFNPNHPENRELLDQQANKFFTSKFSELDKHIDNPNLENSYNNQKSEFKYSHTPPKMMENNQVFGFSADARRVDNSHIVKEVDNQISNQDNLLKNQGIEGLRNDESKINSGVKVGVEHELNKGVTREPLEHIATTSYDTVKDLASVGKQGVITVTDEMGKGITKTSGAMNDIYGEHGKFDKK
jgi:conjugal transfer mating pair stabilization protein TraG